MNGCLEAQACMVKLLLFSGLGKHLTAQRVPAAEKDQMTPQKRKAIETKVL